jgi:hypothetical protein
MEIKPSFPKARRSTPVLECRNNYYVVPLDGLFHYFPIKLNVSELEDTSKKFVSLIKSPPILIDGFIISNRRAFEVTSEDILRGRICKSTEFTIERNDNDPTTDKTSSTAFNTAVFGSSNEHSVIGATDMEVREVADQAWQEQVGTLLDTLSSKEGGEWIVEEAPQS